MSKLYPAGFRSGLKKGELQECQQEMIPGVIVEPCSQHDLTILFDLAAINVLVGIFDTASSSQL